MLANAHLLRRGRLDEARVGKASEAIEAGVLLLSRLIDDLLDVSRIMNGKLPVCLRPVDLADVVRSVVESVAEKCARCSLLVSLAFPPAATPATVLGDAYRLRQGCPPVSRRTCPSPWISTR